MRAELKKPDGPLNSVDVASFEFLVTPSITSLKGVECLTSLKSLDFGSLPARQSDGPQPARGAQQARGHQYHAQPDCEPRAARQAAKLAQIYMALIPVEVDLTPLATAPALDYLDIQHDTLRASHRWAAYRLCARSGSAPATRRTLQHCSRQELGRPGCNRRVQRRGRLLLA